MKSVSSLLAMALIVAGILTGCGGSPAPAAATPPPGFTGTHAVPQPSLPAGNSGATLDSAQAALNAGNVAEAERAYRELVARDPKSAQAQFGLGNVLVRGNKLAEAETAYKAALGADPKLAAAHANLGVVYYQLGQFSKAADAFNAALKINSEDAQTLYLLAAVRIQENNISEAEKLLNQAKGIDPNLAEVYYGLGTVYKERGMKAEAIAAFEKFLALGTSQDPQAKNFAEQELKTLKGQ